MTHDTTYVDTLPSEEQIKRDFVTSKGNGSHISLLRLLQSGLTVAQVERYTEDEVRQHYLMLKSKYIELWDKVFTKVFFYCYSYYHGICFLGCHYLFVYSLFNVYFSYTGRSHAWCRQGERGSSRCLPSIPLPLCSQPIPYNGYVREGLLGEQATHHA